MGENALKERTSGTVTMTIIGLASNKVMHELLEYPMCLDRMCLPIQRLAQLFESGYGIHHAGMVRAHRGLTGRLFANGLLKVILGL
ncbi:Activating signal cointegrator 1 complex subunit 3 [Artemisia annua]|uniref:Activating signal cointegrator 1 complex subunit 3 n=1 Tax=Artemisia annua TaxID=35608 RepID=A0A2U1MF79_ARTAN|nr:Activating signal cointegrator 1 complex subunit 3 [Artemisia annua]